MITLLLDWPANSPDISIIDNLWTVFKRMVAERQPTSLSELLDFSQQERGAGEISTNTIKTLYDSPPKRINGDLAARGGSTKY